MALSDTYDIKCTVMQGGSSRHLLRNQVKDAFRRNQHETDPKKIEEQKNAYVCN